MYSEQLETIVMKQIYGKVRTLNYVKSQKKTVVSIMTSSKAMNGAVDLVAS